MTKEKNGFTQRNAKIYNFCGNVYLVCYKCVMQNTGYILPKIKKIKTERE